LKKRRKRRGCSRAMEWRVVWKWGDNPSHLRLIPRALPPVFLSSTILSRLARETLHEDVASSGTTGAGD
jgi:hypothetical protein